jgi:hypothetical protein
LGQACPVWAKILGVALLVTVVVAGAIFAGVYFGTKGQYFNFFSSVGDISSLLSNIREKEKSVC